MTCNICDFGALGDGKTLNTAAIQAAIDACTAAGGGRVVVPAGKYLSGTLCLKSNVELHLESGAELIASLDPADMPDMLGSFEDDNRDTGWEGGCFLLARHAENITISGPGRIDGRGREVFFEDDVDGGSHESPLKVRSFRPRMSFLEDVRNLTVKDVTFYDAAFWTLHMAGCRNVLIDGIRNVSIRDSSFLWKQQGSQVPDCLDEQPSRRGVWPCEVPMAYVRWGEGISLRDHVRFTVDESLEPYIRQTLLFEHASEE